MNSCRPKSPTRAEAIAIALRPQPVYSMGVLLGNWVEERTECPKAGTLYFPPKEKIDYEKMKPESRRPDYITNKLNNSNCGAAITIRHDSHDACKNFVTTNDLVYAHLPKPLCGPLQRHYRLCSWSPQPDNMECFGNLTEWGLRKFKQREWECTDVSDYSCTQYDDSYTPPRPEQYLQPSERQARDATFTKGYQFSMLNKLAKKPKKKQ